jgi:1,4-alpha-glucan branching enzyme
MVYKNIFPLFLNKTTCQFTVWAPKAESVQLLLQGHDQPYDMHREKFGYGKSQLKTFHRVRGTIIS